MRGNTKIAAKILTVILSVLLFAEAIPMQIFAADKETGSGTEKAGVQVTEISETEPEESAEILCEDKSKRDENTKQFKMSDGTYQAVQYSEAVHIKNENGEWEDIDNTLRETEAETEENIGKLIKSKDFVNNANGLSVRLSKKTNKNKFVSLTKDGYSLSWYYEEANKKTGEVTETQDDGDLTTLEKISAEVIYKNVYKEVDFQYIVKTNSLKENIILNSNKAQNEFVAEYKCRGMTVTQADEKTIEFKDENGKTVFTLNAPFMMDANGEMSDSVSLILLAQNGNKVRIKMTADRAWIDDSSRAFPITVDPAIQTEQKRDKMISTYVNSCNPNTANGTQADNSGSMYVGKNIYQIGDARSYIKVNELPDLGGIASKVIDAKLAVCKRNCFTYSDNLIVDAYKVTGSWSKSSLTYNNQPSHDIQKVDYFTVKADNKIQPDYHDNYGYSEWEYLEITDLAKGWYEGEANNGIMLDTDYTGTSKLWMFSIEYTTYENLKPVFVVTYRNMSGYEDYWSYTSMEAGFGGAVSVNNYNGNLVFTQPLTKSAGGNLMPVDISLVYNSNGVDAPYTYMADRMQTNYHIYLRYDSALASQGYRYYLSDADGTKHWFYFENLTTNTGKDEDNLGYIFDIIDLNSDSLCNEARFRITDKDKNKMYFNNLGNLIKIINANNNSSTVQYETVSDIIRIKNIIDGAGRVYTFNYNPIYPDLCISIADPVGRLTRFEYAWGYLYTIIFPDGEYYQFSYSDENLLSQINGLDSNRTKIVYDGSAQKRVKSINRGVSDNYLLESCSFIYNQNETKITDKQGRSYTYQFNDWGQTTGIVSNIDGQAQFFEYGGNGQNAADKNKIISESKVLSYSNNYIRDPSVDGTYSDCYKQYGYSTAGTYSAVKDTTKGNISNGSIKLTKSDTYGDIYAYQYAGALGAGTYTLSGYVNTDGADLGGNGVLLGIEFRDANQNITGTNNIEKVTKTDGWEKFSVTFDLPSGHSAALIAGIRDTASGTVWFDDFQLEKGTSTSNSCNIIKNSSFINGTDDFVYDGSCDIVNLADGELPGISKAVKFYSSTKERRNFAQVIKNSGKKGDSFAFGMWVKAASAPTENKSINTPNAPQAKLLIEFYDVNDKYLSCAEQDINSDIDTWQFVSKNAIAPEDYSRINLYFIYDYNVNSAYIAGMYGYKEQFGQTFDYDKDGNVVSAVDLAKLQSQFSYYGNQMAKMLNPSGSKYMYTYDEQNKLTTALSSDGQEYDFKYDDKGNVIESSIVAKKPELSLKSNTKYYIINAHSGEAIDSGWHGAGQETTTYRYDLTSPYQQWYLEPVAGQTDVYYIKSSYYDENYCLDVRDGKTADGTNIQICRRFYNDAQKFKIVKKGDNTFGIFTGVTNFSKCFDAQYNIGKEIKMSYPIFQNTCDQSNMSDGALWYFYEVTEPNEKTISTTSSYTENKNFVSSMADQRGNSTSYSYDQAKGLLNSTTDALGRTTNYTYNADNNNLLSVSSGGMTNSYTYANDGKLTDINVNNGVKYKFEYDAFGRTTNTKVGNGTSYRVLSSLEYNSQNLLSKQTYGNNDFITFSYDSLDRITEKKYNNDNSKRVTYQYGNDGSLASKTDYFTGETEKYVYDLAGRAVRQKTYKDGALNSSLSYTYADKTDYLTGVKHFSPLGTQDIGYRYGNIANGEMPDQIYGVTWNGTERVGYTYDGLGRLTNKQIKASDTVNLNNNYTYVDVADSNKTTTLVNSVQNAAGTYTYTYDSVGNITSINDGAYTVSYVYDDLNQLVRENDQKAGRTYIYTYSNGNILSKKTYIYTTGEPQTEWDSSDWIYGSSEWGDLLTNYNGAPITYDEIGNPTQLGNLSLTWSGRQLDSINGIASYKYNADGQRVSKTVNNVTTEYIYNGSILAGVKWLDYDLVYMYDNNGDIFGFNLDGKNYYYIKNAQNDVIAMTNESGTIICRYHYDAWGNMTEQRLSTNTDDSFAISNNHITYRSYFFDSEINMYYLNSRYYSPDLCRFLNSDGIYDTNTGMLSHNMFAYCNNNPVNRVDFGGTFSFLVALVAVVAVSLITTVIGNVLLKKKASENIVSNAGVAAVDKVIPGVENAKKVYDVKDTNNNAKKDLQNHTKNVYNANLSNKKGIKPKILSFNSSIYSSDSDYEKHCINVANTLSTYLLASGVDDNLDWDSIGTENQYHIISNMAYWDEKSLNDIRTYYGAEGFVDVIF